MDVTTVGVDLAKHVFQVHGVTQRGTVSIHKQLKRIVRGAAAKSGNTRYVPLNDEAMMHLKDWQKESIEGKRLFPVTTSFKTAWGALLERAKVTHFCWHDLRHHFASSLVQAGVPLNMVRELLGHGSLAMTLRCAHLAPNQTRDTVAKLIHIPAAA
jgi:integrase